MHEGRELIREFYSKQERKSKASLWSDPHEYAICFDIDPLTPESSKPIQPAHDWEGLFRKALAQLSGLVRERAEHLLLSKLEKELESLKKKLQRLEQGQCLIVPITTFAPEPFDLLQEIKVVVRPSDEEFLASFFDANVNAAGSTETDAVQNLKDVMLGLFDYLEVQPAKRLGPGPKRQLEVLRQFIRKRE